MAKAALNKK